MELRSPDQWQDYELLDVGHFKKLERFGTKILIRPEPQAIWNPVWTEEEWLKKAQVKFLREIKNPVKSTDGWQFLSGNDKPWNITYPVGSRQIKLKLNYTSFGHIGVFPEQADNWEFIYKTICEWKSTGHVLNLFAYTGAASIVARAAGAEVTHVDAVRNMITWANENQQLSQVDQIRWVVEDAVKFVKREIKRGKKYQGIILDPPAYGRGPEGEKWVLEEGLNELIKLCRELLDSTRHFLVVNLYSMGYSSLVVANMIKTQFSAANLSFGELYIQSTTGLPLPLGSFARFKN